MILRPITDQDDSQVAELIRVVMTEIGASGEGFSIHDPEVLAMSSHYPAPRAGFWVLEHNDRIVGCGGFAPLTGADETTCELRKMYFYPEARGQGKAQELLTLILQAAKQAGYREMYLETLATADKARTLYERNGFLPLAGACGSTGHHGCDTFYRREL